jgi:hypothetical protein
MWWLIKVYINPNYNDVITQVKNNAKNKLHRPRNHRKHTPCAPKQTNQGLNATVLAKLESKNPAAASKTA